MEEKLQAIKTLWYSVVCAAIIALIYWLLPPTFPFGIKMIMTFCAAIPVPLLLLVIFPNVKGPESVERYLEWFASGAVKEKVFNFDGTAVFAVIAAILVGVIVAGILINGLFVFIPDLRIRSLFILIDLFLAYILIYPMVLINFWVIYKNQKDE